MTQVDSKTKLNEQAVKQLEQAAKLQVNDTLYSKGLITKTMYEYARKQLLKSAVA